MKTDEALGTITFDRIKEFIGDDILRAEGFQEWANSEGSSIEDVISKDGVPLVFFHGGSAGIEGFNRDNPRNTGDHQHGYYFSPRALDARFYAQKLKAERMEEGADIDSSVYAVALRIKNPQVIQGGDGQSSASINDIPEDYDGIINQSSQEVVVFDPSQVFIAAETKV